MEKTVLTKEKLQKMCLPARYWKTKLEIVPDRVREYISNLLYNLETFIQNGYSAIFFGDNGVGKTSIAALMIKEARRLRHDVLFISSQDILNLYESSNIDHYMIKTIENIEFLVIDELGKEVSRFGAKNRMEVVVNIFDNLLRKRHFGLRNTVMTTNLDLEQILDRYGKSMFSLFSEDHLILRIPGNNLREGKEVMLDIVKERFNEM